MASLQFRSLYLKAVAPMVVLVLASMGAVWFFAVHTMSEGVQVAAEQRAEFSLGYVRDSLEDVDGMEGDDGDHLQQVVERLGRNPDTDVIRIFSPAGRVMYSSRSDEVGTTLVDRVPTSAEAFAGPDAISVGRVLPDGVYATGPVFNGPSCARCHGSETPILGYVEVDISLSRQSAGMRTWGEMAVAAGVLQFAAVAIGVILIMGLVVVRPIRRLSKSMSDVRLGNLAVVAPPAGTTEIDTLVTGFNDMVGRLRRSSELEEQVQRTKMARIEQFATLGELAASLAHELRNPLSGVKAAIDVLAQDEKAEEPRRIMRHMSDELARVDGVVRQLMSFAKPRAPVVSRVDLNDVLGDAVMLSRPRAVAQRANLDLAKATGPVAVLADAEMVQQVVVNLLINALHATQGHEGRIVVSAVRNGTNARCTVRDNGPGVPAARGETIFKPFVTTKPRGTGLGLATSRRLIDLQGGQLWLANPGEPGACFTFTLPLDPGVDAG